MAYYGIELLRLPCMAFYGLLWSFAAFHDHRHEVASFDLVWSCMALLWSYMAFYGLLWQHIVFSRCHGSKFIWSCLTIDLINTK